MLYLNNSLLTANGIIGELKKIPTDNPRFLKSFKTKLVMIYFPQMGLEQIKTEIQSERFSEFPQLQFVLEELFFKEHHPGVINTEALEDWKVPETYQNKSFQELNSHYNYFPVQGEVVFNKLKPLCRKMTQLVERQADDNEMAYKLMALFCEPEDLLDADKCLQKISKSFIDISKVNQHGKPYHDAFVTILHHFPSIIDAKNIQEWRQFILTFGFPGLACFADCRSFESVPKTLKEAQTAQLAKSYPRANENIEFAKFCKSNRIDNEGFEAGLKFIFQCGWPVKTQDNLPLVDIKLIDESTNTEYRWVKLPPDDWRALYLGNMIPGCCQFINGHSRQCVIDGITLADNGFYVLLKKKIKKSSEESADLLDGDIVAQAYTWISKNGNLVLDSIEWDEKRVTIDKLQHIIQLFARQVLRENPEIKYINVGKGGQTPVGFAVNAWQSEQQKQGTQYGDSSAQYSIASSVSPDLLDKVLLQLDPPFISKDKITYLAPYLDSTNLGQYNFIEIAELVQKCYFKFLPTIKHLLTATDFRKLSFEQYQQLSDSEKTEVSTFAMLLNCDSTESFIQWFPFLDPLARFDALKYYTHNHHMILTEISRQPHLLPSILRYIPEHQRVELIRETKDIDNQNILHQIALQPHLLQALLELIPKHQHHDVLREQDRYNNSVLHKAAENPESLKLVMQAYPEEEILDALMAKNNIGNRVIHLAAANSESLKLVLDVYPEQAQFVAVLPKNKYGNRVLHLAAVNPESLKLVLELYPEDQRLSAIKEKNLSENTVLHLAAVNPESLKLVLELYPEEQRLSAIKEKNCNNESLIYKAIKNLESLKMVLEYYPDHERLAVLTEKNLNGDTALSQIIFNREIFIESVALILQLIPKEQRLHAIKEKHNGMYSLLDNSHSHPELLTIFQKFCPEVLLNQGNLASSSGFEKDKKEKDGALKFSIFFAPVINDISMKRDDLLERHCTTAFQATDHLYRNLDLNIKKLDRGMLSLQQFSDCTEQLINGSREELEKQRGWKYLLWSTSFIGAFVFTCDIICKYFTGKHISLFQTASSKILDNLEEKLQEIKQISLSAKII